MFEVLRVSYNMEDGTTCVSLSFLSQAENTRFANFLTEIEKKGKKQRGLLHKMDL